MAEKNVPAGKKQRIKMREQEINERIRNFLEVPLGYSEKEAIEEASRCLQCKN
ncbi:MAG TPA: dihydropyrimidine dehydrogenase, partial [Candidatus Goldiibacteriota bacterium]|nr:dihydropyrimidine dehydrogenase [Candidatus Goldiibacteriota bacterium]